MVYLGIFLSSLLGSLHCLGMCGAFLPAFVKDHRSNMSYQFGRILSYTFLGFTAGFLGEKMFFVLFSKHQQQVASLLLGSVLFLLGWLMIFNIKKEFFSGTSFSFIKLFFKKIHLQKPFFKVFCLVFLPFSYPADGSMVLLSERSALKVPSKGL